MRGRALGLAAVVLLLVPDAHATSPSFTLAPGSPSLGAATAADVLNPALPPGPAYPIPLAYRLLRPPAWVFSSLVHRTT